jgi:hypothetical protein
MPGGFAPARLSPAAASAYAGAMSKALPVLIAALAALAVPAAGEDGPYKLQNLDFGLWCTEQEHLPYARCEKRLPDDVKKFETYRTLIERYEIPYLQERDRKLRLDRDILHYDPTSQDEPAGTNPPPSDGNGPS